ncbi:hypothetical protein [Ruminococcus flavefaciens]|uniref:hypothetical protein n=1 Tax=Ruminococcus flavefaciens TaxID=1265 RepID=UPI0012BD2A55|nr:hypothetical protein [Ruminococcus flavefaciens]
MIRRVRKMGIFCAAAIIIISIGLWGDMLCEIASLQIHTHKVKKRRKALYENESAE